MSYWKTPVDEAERLFDRAVDRKERLVQTYIVISGLLVACSSTKSHSYFNFYLFLVLAITYYADLSKMRYADFIPVGQNTVLKPSTIRWIISFRLTTFFVSGIASSFFLSLLLVDFSSSSSNSTIDYYWFYVITLTLCISRSLFLSYSEFTPKKMEYYPTQG